MTALLDLNLLPVYRVKGREVPIPPGLKTASPPKRCGRGREDDLLLVYLSLSGNVPLTATEYERLLKLVIDQYYRASGAITSALRTAAEHLNQTLLENNLRNRGKGQHIIGRLILGTLRGTQLLLCQCGPTHVFQFSAQGWLHFHDSSAASRALGASQVTPLYFSQLKLQPGDRLALLASLPAEWEVEQVAGLRSLEQLHKSLVSLSQETLSAILISVTPGKGQMRLLEAPPTERTTPGTAPSEEQVAPAEGKSQPSARGEAASEMPSPLRPTSQVLSRRPASRFARLLAGEEETSQEQRSEEPPASSSQPPSPAARISPVRRAATTGSLPIFLRPTTDTRQRLLRSLAKWLRQLRISLHTANERLQTLLARLLPDLRAEDSRVGGGSLALLALAIPVLVMTVALVFYNQHGRRVSYEENFQQALREAEWAAAQTSPAEIRVGWERTLFYLDIAEQYQQTEDSRQLRFQAQTALDNLDGILRLSFEPAIVNGLGRNINVRALAATTNDLYLLDGTRGSVYRYYLSAQGYQADTAFVCEPGTYGDVTVGPLVDILAAPRVNPYNATLMALDDNGTLLYCFPSPRRPVAVKLARPELGWERLTNFTLDATTNFLYVMDPSRGGVWYYVPDENGKYVNLPISFFGEQVPANMATAIDFATNGSDLYFLFEDGHLASCTLIVFQNVPKRCHDPLLIIDNRPERQSGHRLVEAIFTQMTFAEAPDQSLYLFDPYAPAVYRFSPRVDSLLLLNQFRPAVGQNIIMAEAGASAMAFNANRTLFIGTARQVFYAPDVP